VRHRVSITEKHVTAEFEPDVTPLPDMRGSGWTDLRGRLGRAARELHFVAFASDTPNSGDLLLVSERFADLALSIPMNSEQEAADPRFPQGLVSATTLFTAHLLHYDEGADNEALDIPANE
jgi:hypothetical protein